MSARPKLFKRWITLATENISIQWIVKLVSLILIHCMDSDLSDGKHYPTRASSTLMVNSSGGRNGLLCNSPSILNKVQSRFPCDSYE